jgi:hypothetical protein
MSQDIKDLAIFEEYAIRRVWAEERWWFAVVDVIAALTSSTNPGQYWRTLKSRLDGKELYPFILRCQRFKLFAEDNKLREIDCGDFSILVTLAQYLLLQQNLLSPNTNSQTKTGIYAIENTLTGLRYIGSSGNIAGRYAQHRADLRRGIHHAKILQDAWNTYGEDAFILIILDEVSDVTELENREQYYLDNESPQYNSRKQAINSMSKETVDLDKVNRFLIFLRECELPTYNCEPLRNIEYALQLGLINPGLNYFQFIQAAKSGVQTWEEFQVFLQGKGENL